jgi:hypothetical protein
MNECCEVEQNATDNKTPPTEVRQTENLIQGLVVSTIL